MFFMRVKVDFYKYRHYNTSTVGSPGLKSQELSVSLFLAFCSLDDIFFEIILGLKLCRSHQ